MTTYSPGTIVFLTFPFTHGGWSKARPGLVILDTGDDDAVIAKMTTRVPQDAFDVRLTEWTKAGLNAASTVRLHKLITVEKSLIRRVLGQLHPTDRAAVAKSLQGMLANW